MMIAFHFEVISKFRSSKIVYMPHTYIDRVTGLFVGSEISMFRRFTFR